MSGTKTESKVLARLTATKLENVDVEVIPTCSIPKVNKIGFVGIYFTFIALRCSSNKFLHFLWNIFRFTGKKFKT